MAGSLVVGALTVFIGCRLYHGSLYLIARRHLDSQPGNDYDWSDCMLGMESRGYTAANTAIPAGAKILSDGYLLCVLGSTTIKQLRHIMHEYVYPAMDWVDDLVRGIGHTAEKTFKQLCTKLHAWYEHIKELRLGEAWEAMKKDLYEFLKYVGIGIGSGAFDWSKVWASVKGSTQQLAYRIGNTLWRLCGVLVTLFTDTSVAAGGYLYSWGRTEITIVMLQFGYLAYLVREKYQTAGQLN